MLCISKANTRDRSNCFLEGGKVEKDRPCACFHDEEVFVMLKTVLTGLAVVVAGCIILACERQTARAEALFEKYDAALSNLSVLDSSIREGKGDTNAYNTAFTAFKSNLIQWKGELAGMTSSFTPQTKTWFTNEIRIRRDRLKTITHVPTNTEYDESATPR